MTNIGAGMLGKKDSFPYFGHTILTLKKRTKNIKQLIVNDLKGGGKTFKTT